MDLAGKLMGGLKSVAGAGLNLLPDRINLFSRYLTGVGNSNLQLDRSTEQSLINATEKPPVSMGMVRSWPDQRTAIEGDLSKSKMVESPVVAAGPGIPTSGPTMPYMSGDQVASQTLGRFNAEVTPTTVRVKDTYDMVNESEDPDLVSGQFQPGKAYRTLQGAFDPTKIYHPRIDQLQDISHLLKPEEKDFGAYMREVGKGTTRSPLTDVARAAMYALPVQFQPYEIDYTIQR